MRSGIGGRRNAPYGGAWRFVHLAAAGALMLTAGAAAQAPQAQPRELHVLALGDSLTAGFGLPRPQGFVPQLQAYLRRQGVRAFVTNAGVSGDTAAQGLQRLAWTLDGLERRPDLVIVELGANDMLRGLPPAETRAALDSVLAELQRRGIRILLTGMVASPNLGPDFAARFNAIYPKLARKYRATLHPFFLNGVAGQQGLNQADGIHPNFEGVKLVVMGMAPSVISASGS